ncbi:hypothetical protein P691DRAFT_739496 [Macrolepiota fuliginosa MF-IS2]|uniref:Phytocyanin domain-containing protein n=1 Tax=Macrolepiota fuliginosa MF-IS2 TaxID=1400762 RepID=A0A9P6BWB8_9AGAR|nr:hypothetical protein P691DRAFT_739496 [Macrolepiota fuliginosa MF-IS2]
MKPVALVALLLSSAFAVEYLVGVGKDETTGKKGIGFDPSVIHPIAGDTVVFEFRGGAHSAVQTTFETPCVPLDGGGFNSGVFNVDTSLPVDAPGLPSVQITINDTNPIWIFDQAGGQCQQGGVLAINPTQTQTPAQYKENAAKSPVAPLTKDAAPSATASGSGAPAEASGSANDNKSNGASGLRMSIGGVGLAGVVMALVAGSV